MRIEFDEREKVKAERARKRVIRLAVICAVAIVARLVIKDPPPPKRADHGNVQGVVLPGMLDRIPVSEQAKLDPRLLARMREADVKARLKTDEKAAPYVPAAEPLPDLKEQQLDREYSYQYVRRQKIIEQKHQETSVDVTKTVLVRFKNGRHVKVRRTREAPPHLAIELDRTIVASVPKKIILSVTEDALTWEEPVGTGNVRLKPAKGISITVRKTIAPRITIAKAYRDES